MWQQACLFLIQAQNFCCCRNLCSAACLLPYQRQHSSCDDLRGEVCVGVPRPVGDQHQEVNNQPSDVICWRNDPSWKAVSSTARWPLPKPPSGFVCSS